MKIWILLAATVLTTVVAPARRTTEKMVFIVDKSGSMNAKDSADAIEQFVTIAMSADPSLDVEICLYVFGKTSKRWKYGWQELPSVPVLKAAKEFLETEDVGMDTFVIPALRRALGEHKKKLTAIIITDGQFNEETDEVIKALRTAQVNRILRGKPVAVIGCIGVGNQQEDSLKAIAKMGRGGYYHAVRKRDEDEAH